jgi:hypothetical protein
MGQSIRKPRHLRDPNSPWTQKHEPTQLEAYAATIEYKQPRGKLTPILLVGPRKSGSFSLSLLSHSTFRAGKGTVCKQLAFANPSLGPTLTIRAYEDWEEMHMIIIKFLLCFFPFFNTKTEQSGRILFNFANLMLRKMLSTPKYFPPNLPARTTMNTKKLIG